MPRGGARIGAGRKPKARPMPLTDAAGFKTEAAPKDLPFGMQKPAESTPPPAPVVEPEAEMPQEVVDPSLTPLDYLLSVMRNPLKPDAQRITAAVQAAPYLHQKKGDAGKKAATAEAAEKLAAKADRLTTRPPPLRAVK